jgi:hypothetical protein
LIDRLAPRRTRFDCEQKLGRRCRRISGILIVNRNIQDSGSLVVDIWKESEIAAGDEAVDVRHRAGEGYLAASPFDRDSIARHRRQRAAIDEECDNDRAFLIVRERHARDGSRNVFIDKERRRARRNADVRGVFRNATVDRARAEQIDRAVAIEITGGDVDELRSRRVDGGLDDVLLKAAVGLVLIPGQRAAASGSRPRGRRKNVQPTIAVDVQYLEVDGRRLASGNPCSHHFGRGKRTVAISAEQVDTLVVGADGNRIKIAVTIDVANLDVFEPMAQAEAVLHGLVVRRREAARPVAQLGHDVSG